MKWLEIKVRNCQLHLFDSPYSKMILRSSWTFWKAWNVLYNPYLKWILRYLLELGEKLPWSWVQNLPKLGQNFTKLKSLWTPIHKIITWDPSIFWENFVNQSCIFCGGLQLSCWKFSLNPIASWWKSCGKLGKNKKFSILRKILSYEKFQIKTLICKFSFLGQQVSYFDISWWIMTLGIWFWPKSQSLTFQYIVDFWSVDWKFICQSIGLEQCFEPCN